MASFKAGPHEWKVRLTVGTLGTIKREYGLDLAGALASGERFVEVLLAETEKLFEALWIACEEQAAAAGVTREQFANMLDGDSMEAATGTLLEAAIDFFPKARGRDAIKSGLPRALKAMEEKTNAAIEKNLSTFLDTAGGSPES